MSTNKGQPFGWPFFILAYRLEEFEGVTDHFGGFVGWDDVNGFGILGGNLGVLINA